MITNPHCEISVAHHCNLACRACSHLSPILPKQFVDLDVLRADLTTLATVYHAEEARLLGGEPLLHPDLEAVIAVVRASGIADRVEVWTNGLLLDRMGDGFWAAVDRVVVSAYPGKEQTAAEVRRCHRRANEHGVRLAISVAEIFRESHAEHGTRDLGLIERIYATCQTRRCHHIERGRFHKCPPSIFLPQVLEALRDDPHVDGLPIVAGPDFAARLRAYLDDPAPLRSCGHCLGSVGRAIPSTQVRRPDWRAPQQATTEALLDAELLAALEASDRQSATLAAARPRTGYGLFNRKKLLQYMGRRHGVAEQVRTAISLAGQELSRLRPRRTPRSTPPRR